MARKILLITGDGGESYEALYARHRFLEAGFQPVPTFYAWAWPSGPLTDDCFAELLQRLKSAIGNASTWTKVWRKGTRGPSRHTSDLHNLWGLSDVPQNRLD